MPFHPVSPVVIRLVAGLLISAVLAVGTAVLSSTSALAATTAASPGTYPPQGATWRRDGVLSIYKITSPRQGSEPGPIRYAVGVWQELLAEMGFTVPRNSVYDEATAAAVARFQRRAGFAATGEINLPTARALLGPTIRREALRAGAPVGVLCGHLAAESLLDPAAVGTNGVDLGVAQISVPYNLNLTEQQMFDEDAAIRYMAERNAKAYARFGDWRIAVVSYNSPVRASAWFRTGEPSELALTYATRAMRGCGPIAPTVTVTTETSLWRLAVTQLGDGLRWSDIAAVNGLTRTAVLTPGQVVNLPKP